MKTSSIGEIDSYSVSPFLTLLPSVAAVSEVEKYSASFFARHEKAVNLKAALSTDGEPENLQQLNAEIEMLKTVLEWLNFSRDAAL